LSDLLHLELFGPLNNLLSSRVVGLELVFDSALLKGLGLITLAAGDNLSIL